MAIQGANVTGIDMSFAPLEVARRHAQESDLSIAYLQTTIEKMAEKVRQIAANKESFAIPEELKQAANAHRELKTEINKKGKK